MLTFEAKSQVAGLASERVSMWGFADAYYAYKFASADSARLAPYLYSHNRHNAFSVNHVVLGLTLSDSLVRGALAFHTGTYPTDNYAHEPQLLRHIYEVNAGIKVIRGLWLEAGIFPSHIGFESAISADNWTLSRSLMAENSPYYETGVRLSFEPTERFTFQFLVLNGWQVIAEENKQKAVCLKAAWAPARNLTLNYSNYFGKEGPTKNPEFTPIRFFQNVFVKFTSKQGLRLGLAADLGIQERLGTSSAIWHTASLFVGREIGRRWAVTARGEYYSDKTGTLIFGDGVSPFSARGGSLTVDYTPAKPAMLRAEIRQLRNKYATFPAGKSMVIMMSSLSVKF